MTAGEDLVSVIIPTRNRSERLLLAVNSVQDQTYRHLEIIIVDDASCDDTPSLASAMAREDPRLVIVRNEEATGAARARNQGIAASHGSFVAFLDDDDVWLRRKLGDQMAFLQARSDVGLVCCQYELVDPRGRVREHRGPIDVSYSDLLWCNFLGGASVVVARRDSLPEHPVWDPNLVFGEDWDMFVRCASRGRIGVLDEILVSYAAHSGPRLTTSGRRAEDLARFVAKHAPSMSPSCLEYHQARAQIARASSRFKIFLGLGLLAKASPGVRRALALESINGRIGRLTRDPGRSLRHLHTHIRHLAGIDQVGTIGAGG